jgi:glycine cleavage system H protein
MEGDIAMKDLLFTNEHEWVRIQGEEAQIGVSDYAQGEMGDVVFVELPDVGKEVKPGDILATLESVKAVSDVYAPVAGEVIKVNEELEDNPELINEDAYGKGWIAVIKFEGGQKIEGFMTAEEYESFIKGGE